MKTYTTTRDPASEGMEALREENRQRDLICEVVTLLSGEFEHGNTDGWIVSFQTSEKANAFVEIIEGMEFWGLVSVPEHLFMFRIVGQ